MSKPKRIKMYIPPESLTVTPEMIDGIQQDALSDTDRDLPEPLSDVLEDNKLLLQWLLSELRENDNHLLTLIARSRRASPDEIVERYLPRRGITPLRELSESMPNHITRSLVTALLTQLTNFVSMHPKMNIMDILDIDTVDDHITVTFKIPRG